MPHCLSRKTTNPPKIAVINFRTASLHQFGKQDHHQREIWWNAWSIFLNLTSKSRSNLNLHCQDITMSQDDFKWEVNVISNHLLYSKNKRNNVLPARVQGLQHHGNSTTHCSYIWNWCNWWAEVHDALTISRWCNIALSKVNIAPTHPRTSMEILSKAFVQEKGACNLDYI